MWKQNLIPPFFSLAVNWQTQDGDNGGYVALGGIPPVPFTSPHASTPVLVTNVGWSNHTNLKFYYILIQAMTDQAGANISSSEQPATSTRVFINSTSYEATLDSGTGSLYLPTSQKDAINALFQSLQCTNKERGGSTALQSHLG